MAAEPKTLSFKKKGLHARNPHRGRYDFDVLTKRCPELGAYVVQNAYGNASIDFANPVAVKMLNKAILMQVYGLRHWDIPDNYLCPPIPGRADYIHHMADLLAEANQGEVPVGKSVAVLDVGVGANVIYPIIGHCAYGWRFVGSDIDPVAIGSAQVIAKANPVLKRAVQCRLQTQPEAVFSGIIKPDEYYDFTLCNPPFHASKQQAAAGTRRKLNNLASAKSRTLKSDPPVLNFGGQQTELCCPGGEAAFIQRMVQESTQVAEHCLWFSSLVSKKDNLPVIYAALKKAKASKIKTINMAQGQKVSRIVAWSFLNEVDRLAWAQVRWQS
ncbi:MAG: 23S rRNA (adenine(1618)-N(6))-methyltransferase RlmF [Pontibacterium sp.]